MKPPLDDIGTMKAVAEQKQAKYAIERRAKSKAVQDFYAEKFRGKIK